MTTTITITKVLSEGLLLVDWFASEEEDDDDEEAAALSCPVVAPSPEVAIEDVNSAVVLEEVEIENRKASSGRTERLLEFTRGQSEEFVYPVTIANLK